jgi:hypothetical protein
MAATEKREESIPSAEESIQESDEEETLVPDWLQRLAPTEHTAPAPTEPQDIALPTEAQIEAPAADSEKSSDSPLPEWLRAIVASEEAEEPVSNASKEASEEAPSWLRDIVSTQEDQTLKSAGLLDISPAMAEEPDKETNSAGDLLSWLLQTGQEETAQPTEAQVAEPNAPIPQPTEAPTETPSLFQPAADIAAVPTDTAAATVPADISSEHETNARDFIIEPAIPDWLRQAAETPQGTARPAAEEEEEIPDWLRNLVAPEQHQEQETLPELPTPPPRGPVQEVEQVNESESSLAKSEIPDWLRDMAPKESLEQETSEEAFPALTKAEIPDWLEALRPAGEPQPQPEAEKTTEGSGLLSGIRGILPVEMAWALPRRAQAFPLPPPPAGETGPVALFAEILEGKPEKRIIAAQRKGEVIPGALTRRLIYLLLIAAILFALFFRPDWLGSQVVVSPPARDFAGAIGGLAANSTVLVAFDYDPTFAAELDLQAMAVLRHILETKCSVIALSLTAQGASLAQVAWEKVAAESAQNGQKYQYGQDFVNLGYLVAQEAGLRALIQGLPFSQDFAERKPLSSYALTQKARSLQDFALIVVLSGEPESVRRWIEQVKSAYPIKMVAGVSALASPSLAPYYPKQLTGILGGLPGAAEYELALNRPGTALAGLGAQSAAHVVVVLVIILGNLALLASRSGKRK